MQLQAARSDITARRQRDLERERLERERASQTQLLRAIIDNTEAMIYVKDLEGRYLTVNALFERTSGFSEARLLGRTDDAISPESAQQWRDADAQARLGPVRHRSQVALSGGRGTRQFVHVKFPLHDADGTLYATGGISQDITDLATANDEMAAARDEALALAAAMRDQARQHKAILDNAHSAVISLNRHGDVTYWNPQAEKVFGYSAAEAVGSGLAELIIPVRYRAAHREGLERFMSTGEGPILNQRIEISALKRDGEEFPVELTVAALPESDYWAFHAFIKDISVERELLDQLNRSNEDLRQFAYVASHDLQAPLRTIGGFTEVLVAGFDGAELTDQQRMMASHIVSGVATLQRLIRDLLAFSRIGSAAAPAAEVAIATAHADVINLLDLDISELGADVTCTATGSVLIERSQLHQILLNLIQNALRHRAPGRAPVVVTSSRELPSGFVEIAVADNGPGIDPRYQDRVFDMFKQGHASEGTGMGLTIVRRVIERNGGAICIDSDGSNGTTMRFTLRRSG